MGKVHRVVSVLSSFWSLRRWPRLPSTVFHKSCDYPEIEQDGRGATGGLSASVHGQPSCPLQSTIVVKLVKTVLDCIRS